MPSDLFGVNVQLNNANVYEYSVNYSGAPPDLQTAAVDILTAEHLPRIMPIAPFTLPPRGNIPRDAVNYLWHSITVTYTRANGIGGPNGPFGPGVFNFDVQGKNYQGRSPVTFCSASLSFTNADAVKTITLNFPWAQRRMNPGLTPPIFRYQAIETSPMEGEPMNFRITSWRVGESFQTLEIILKALVRRPGDQN